MITVQVVPDGNMPILHWQQGKDVLAVAVGTLANDFAEQQDEDRRPTEG